MHQKVQQSFFAVFSEVFFETPLIVKHHFPAIYEQLALFYRQDPVGRIDRISLKKLDCGCGYE